MSILLFITTIILDLAGLAFAGTYVWLNSFSSITDLKDRNIGILKITKASVAMSLIFALLSCLLSNGSSIESSISRATTLFSIIAISWLVVILGCGVALLFTFIKKAEFKADLLKSIKKIFVIALWGAIIGIVCAWLFS